MKDSKNILEIFGNEVFRIKDYRIKSITIPEGIKTIGKCAFAGCGNLKNIVFPSSLRRIEENAFFGCGFESVTIPDNVTFLGRNSFKRCLNLKEVLFNGTLDFIEKSAFESNYKSIAFRLPLHWSAEKVTAYKGFNVCSDGRLFCRDFLYREGATYTTDKAKMCECGFHACLNPIDCFNFYYGKLNPSLEFLNCRVEFHEVVIDDIADFDIYGTKVCGKKITIGRKLTINEMFEAYNKIII